MAATTARKEIDLVVVDLGRQQDMMVLKLSQLVGILEQHALDELIDCILRVVDEFLGRSHDWIVALPNARSRAAMTWRSKVAETAKPPPGHQPGEQSATSIHERGSLVVRAYNRRVSHKAGCLLHIANGTAKKTS